MDDMWSIDAWDRVQRFFPNNENGSRVLVTTRLSKLSSQLNDNYSHQMKFLDEGSSWDLFSKIVFGTDSCPLELKEIGKKIAENCRGLPLSIVVVGGLLKKMEHTKEYWESIRKKLTSVVNLENHKHCLRLLKLSYNHLPTHLKPCFLYMGVFEEENEIKVSTLVKLWVCEGFLKPMDGKSLETIATEFLQDLVDRNLILIDELGSTGNIKLVKVHNILRDLCLNQGEKDGFYYVVGQSSDRGINSQRRVVIPRKTSKKEVRDALQSMPHTRSVISEYGKDLQCQNSGLLKVLHAYKFRTWGDKSYVNSLAFHYVNLQHLAVEVDSMSSFFSSLNLLWNLHTLVIYCTRESTAPTEIWKMLRLTNIEFVGRSLHLPDPPSDALILENLHILKGVDNLKFSEDVVKRIPNIKRLGLEYTGREGEASDHGDYDCLSNIKCLCKLESLSILSAFYYGGVSSLHKLTFPHSLKRLSLEMRLDFEWEDMLEKIGSLPLLEKLKLGTGCFRTGKWKIVEGHFTSLKYLGLISCHSLKQLTTQESSIFPNLEQLYLFDLRGLQKICSEIGDVPTLQIIKLHYCNESAAMRVKKIVEEQMDLQGEVSFHVQVWIANENEAVQRLAGPNFEVAR